MNTSDDPSEPALLNPSLQAAFRSLSLLVIVAVAAIAAWQGRVATNRGPDRQDVRFRIDLNTAGERELTLMPGIGAVTARQILRDRDANGPFRSLDDVQRVPGIGPKTIQAIAPFCDVMVEDAYETGRLFVDR